MGTNYYFKIKDVKLNLDFPNNMDGIKNEILEILSEKLDDLTLIHIGKRSAGWKPLFQKTKYFSSVKEIREFYNKNEEALLIINEYDEELTFKELEKELIDWNMGPQPVKPLEHIGLGDSYYIDKELYDFCIYEFS